MKYKKSELEKLALKAIKKHNLIYIEEVCSFLQMHRFQPGTVPLSSQAGKAESKSGVYEQVGTGAFAPIF